MLPVITPNSAPTRPSRWPAFSSASTVFCEGRRGGIVDDRLTSRRCSSMANWNASGNSSGLHLVPGRHAVIGAGPVGEQDVVREVTVLSGDEASATVVLTGPARFWCAPASVLRPYIQAHDEVRRALEQGFAASLQAKLRQSNERIAEAGGVTA
jgi:hypothetical protein